MTAAEIPEVLGVVVEVPGGAGEDFSGGKLEQEGVDDAVLIVGWLIGQARDEAVGDEGEEKVFVVDVMQREHGAAVEQELGRKGLEAEIFQWDAKGWLGDAGEERRGEENQKPGQSGAEKAVLCRVGRSVGHGNQYGI